MFNRYNGIAACCMFFYEKRTADRILIKRITGRVCFIGSGIGLERNYCKEPADSRWLHRIKTYWNVDEQNEAQKEFEHFLRRLIVLRGAEPLLGGNDVYFYDVQSPHVFTFRRSTVHVVANFSETPSTFSTGT
ncbi:MAG: hypothetical protein ACTTKL_03005 [Treponema sp.]